MRRRALPAILLLAVLAALTACAAEEESPDTGWELYQQQSLLEDLQEPAEGPEEPEYPAAFSLAYHKDHTLDPITCGEGIQEDVSSLLYEPLFQLDAAFQPVPVLCERFEWGEQGLVCTLALRQDARFQDGSPLTAGDVVATLRRAIESERYGYRLRGITAVAADRSGQVRITLSAPNQGLPALLDIPIVKSGTERQLVPTGTGPYCLVSDGEGAYLQASESWWQGKRLPVDTIPLVHAKDRDTAMYLFSSHRVELLTVDPTSDLSSATGQSQAAVRPTAILQYIGFNTAEGSFFADPALRAAFHRGIPRDKLADAQLAGLALVCQAPISPRSALYPADLEQDYDRDAALAALRAAGQDTGEPVELTLLVNEEDRFRLASAQFIAENLSLLDWHITVTALPWEAYLMALEAGEFDLYFGEVHLTANWDLTDLVGTGGSLNYGSYTDPTMDLLLQQFAAAGGEDRSLAARRLCVHLQEVCPISPICFKNYLVLTHSGVAEGLAPGASSSFAWLEGWTVRLSS